MTQHQGDNSGISYFFAGLTLIFSKGIKRYTIIPLMINTIIFIALWGSSPVSAVVEFSIYKGYTVFKI